MTLIKNRPLLINIFLGLGIVSFAFLSSPDLHEGMKLMEINPFKKELLSYFLLAAFLFFNFYVLIPKFYIKKKWGLFILLLLLSYGIIHFIPSLLIPLDNIPMRPPGDPNGEPPGSERMALITIPRDRYFFQFALIFILSLYMRLSNYFEEIKNEQLSTELSFLKAQINPHFLFNTLNSIYGLSLQKSDKTPTAILKLSELMRYTVEESALEKIPLKDEMAYLRSYMDLQQLRLNDEANVSFNVQGTLEPWPIVSMLLIPFMENAFKYGISTESPSFVSINISVNKDGKFVFEIENSNFKNQNVDVHSTQIGLTNTKKRLEHSYPGRYTLRITDTPKSYKVILEIQLE